MPGWISAVGGGRHFRGVSSIYQYKNSDGVDPSTVCGQAACATLLTYCGLMPASIDTLRKIEKSHAPDLLGGALGTSPWRIESILADYQANNRHHVSSIDDLKRQMDNAHPVICLIQNETGLGNLIKDRTDWFTAHWFVVFAYDDDGVYVTNYEPEIYLKWDSFNDKWSGVIPQAARVDFRGITNGVNAIPDAFSGGGLGGGGGSAW